MEMHNGSSTNSSNGHQSEAAGRDRGQVVPFGMVLLAGALTPSPLRQQLDIPALCLPLSLDRTLLDLWLELVARTPGCHWLQIVVNSVDDRRAVTKALHNSHLRHMTTPVSVIVDPARWRGTAGLLRDIVHQADLHTETPVLVAEAACLPPPSLAPLFASMDREVGGVVGSGEHDEPAGMYAFRAGIVSSISSRGYHDIKEQLLPDLYRRQIAVVPAQIVKTVRSIRTLDTYLEAIEAIMASEESRVLRATDAEVSNSAYVSRGCLIHDGVVIEDGAIVKQSVILSGARISGGAVVSRSVIGFNEVVGSRRVIRNAIVSQASAREPTRSAMNGRRSNEMAAAVDARASRRWL